jgi:hypothetical protein
MLFFAICVAVAWVAVGLIFGRLMLWALPNIAQDHKKAVRTGTFLGPVMILAFIAAAIIRMIAGDEYKYL